MTLDAQLRIARSQRVVRDQMAARRAETIRRQIEEQRGQPPMPSMPWRRLATDRGEAA